MEMKFFSKNFHPTDFEFLQQEIKLYQNVVDELKYVPNQFNELKNWECALILKVIKQERVRRVLIIQNEATPLPACCLSLGCVVTTMNEEEISSLEETGTKYDLVVSLSLLHKIENDTKFFDKLLTFVKDDGMIGVTFDYHKTGKRLWEDDEHQRTYNINSIKCFIATGKLFGMEIYGEAADYSYQGVHKFNYNISSIIMKKEKQCDISPNDADASLSLAKSGSQNAENL